MAEFKKPYGVIAKLGESSSTVRAMEKANREAHSAYLKGQAFQSGMNSRKR